MKRVVISVFILLYVASHAYAQLSAQKLIVAPRFQSILDSNKTVFISSEYEVSVFYAGALKRPRFMTLGPKNTVYVADMNANHIFALPDRDHDGIADSAIIVSPIVDSAHSCEFYNGALYVAEPSRIRKFLDKDGDGFYESEEPFIKGIGSTGPYNHYTRTILFDTTGGHIYLGVGASCNACREEDNDRATILQFNLDGSGKKIFASGLRNALGLAINPWDHSLWATNADRDGLGDEIPPDLITSVREGSFYGWPFAYGDRKWINFQTSPEYQALLPLTSADTSHVSSMTSADIFLRAHITPMGILFYKDPRTYKKAPPPTAFIALHGSSSNGKKIGEGYEVISIVQDELTKSWTGSNFLKGFLTDSINYTYWGRPCGLIQDSTGDIFLSTDAGIPAIYRIHLKDHNSVSSMASSGQDLSVYPNPVATSATISYQSIRSSTIKLELVDQLGRTISILLEGNSEATQFHIPLNVEAVPNGVYYLRLQTSAGAVIQKVIVTK